MCRETVNSPQTSPGSDCKEIPVEINSEATDPTVVPVVVNPPTKPVEGSTIKAVVTITDFQIVSLLS